MFAKILCALILLASIPAGAATVAGNPMRYVLQQGDSTFDLPEEEHFVTASGAGSRNGSSIANAFSLSDFESSGTWSASDADNKIDPGDVVYFCGAFSLGGGEINPPSGVGGILSGGNRRHVHIRANCSTRGGTDASLSATLNGNNDVFDFNGSDHIDIGFFEAFSGVKFRLLHVTNGSFWLVHDFYNDDGDMSLRRGFHFYSATGTETDIEVYNNHVGNANTCSNSGCSDGINFGGNFTRYYIHHNDIEDWNHSYLELGKHVGVGAGVGGVQEDIYIYENWFGPTYNGYNHPWAIASDSTAPAQSCEIQDAHIWLNYIDASEGGSQFNGDVCGADVHNNIWDYSQHCSNDYDNCSPAKDYWGVGHSLAFGSQSGPPQDIRVYSNTFVGTEHQALRFECSDANCGSTTIAVWNNIFQLCMNDGSSNSTGSDACIWSRNGWTMQELDLDNNQFYSTDLNPAGGYMRNVDGATSYTVASFESFADSASGNQTGSALLTDDTYNGDFTLGGSSPALGNGKTILNGADTLGQVYNVGWADMAILPGRHREMNKATRSAPWDIGAFVD